MKKKNVVLVCLVIGMLLVVSSGCSSIKYHLDPEQYRTPYKKFTRGPAHYHFEYGPYPGTRRDFQFITSIFNKKLMSDPQGPANYMAFVYGVIAIPFDVCMDTILLPVDLICTKPKSSEDN